MAIVAAMRLMVLMSIAVSLAAGQARAGETACWFENGAVVVSAAFGDIAGDFILDLSAPRSQLHDTAAQSHGVETDSARRDLILAGETLHDFEMPVIDLDARSAAFVTSINGVLGADALAPFVIDIRFSPCVVTLYRRTPGRAAGSIRLKVRQVAGAPAMAAAISDGMESRQGWFAIDTGSLGTRIAGASLSRTPPKGADPASPSVRLRALSLGGRLFEQPPAGLMKDAPAGLDGAIGNAIWSRYRLRLDIRGGWLDLTPDP